MGQREDDYFKRRAELEKLRAELLRRFNEVFGSSPDDDPEMEAAIMMAADLFR